MMCRMIQYTFLTLFFGAAVYGVFIQNEDTANQSPVQHVVTIRGHRLNVDVAATPQARAQGLAGREFLADDEGMIFYFEKPEMRSFWMKDMIIPIDIIWIQDFTIVGYEDDVKPEPGVPDQDLRNYVSPEPVQKVLEVRSGLRKELGWEVGDAVGIPLD
ncbi:MAG: DUF192 domain-containing protein [Patescibacteria group bacterium]